MSGEKMVCRFLCEAIIRDIDGENERRFNICIAESRLFSYEKLSETNQPTTEEVKSFFTGKGAEHPGVLPAKRVEHRKNGKEYMIFQWCWCMHDKQWRVIYISLYIPTDGTIFFLRTEDRIKAQFKVIDK